MQGNEVLHNAYFITYPGDEDNQVFVPMTVCFVVGFCQPQPAIFAAWSGGGREVKCVVGG